MNLIIKNLKVSVFFAFLMSASANTLSSNAFYTLVDSHGNSVSSNTYSGKVQVVFFGFAECGDVCPVSLAVIKEAYSSLEPSVKKDVQPIFITVDPERDTVSKVKHYVSHFGNMVGLTGTSENIKDAMRSFKVFAMQEIGKTEFDYDINHTSLIYLLDKNGQPCETAPSDVSTVELAQLIESIASSKHICKGFV